MRDYVQKQTTVMKHGVCKGTQAPAPKDVITKVSSEQKTGIAGTGAETGKEK